MIHVQSIDLLSTTQLRLLCALKAAAIAGAARSAGCWGKAVRREKVVPPPKPHPQTLSRWSSGRRRAGRSF